MLLAALLVLPIGGCKSLFPKKEKSLADENPHAAAVGPDDSRPASKRPPKKADEGDLETFLTALRKAVAERDMGMIASMMTANFGYQLEPPREGEGVFRFWDEHGLWEELALVVNEPFAAHGGFHVSPPVFLDPASGYTGYRAGVRKLNGRWKFVYFVNG